MQAALKGAREIGFTVISLTLSLIAVFIPLLFMTGLVGRMFREFALTLTIAVVISAVVSLTLTPMMCSRMLRHEPAAQAEPHRALLQRRRRAGSIARLPPQPRCGCCATSAPRCSRRWPRSSSPSGSTCRAEGLPAAAGHRAHHGRAWRPAPRSRSPRWSGCRATVADGDPQGPRRRRRRLGGRRRARSTPRPTPGTSRSR